MGTYLLKTGSYCVDQAGVKLLELTGINKGRHPRSQYPREETLKLRKMYPSNCFHALVIFLHNLTEQWPRPPVCPTHPSLGGVPSRPAHTADMVVLKGVPALLSPELLYALARMGHGDEIGKRARGAGWETPGIVLRKRLGHCCGHPALLSRKSQPCLPRELGTGNWELETRNWAVPVMRSQLPLAQVELYQPGCPGQMDQNSFSSPRPTLSLKGHP